MFIMYYKFTDTSSKARPEFFSSDWCLKQYKTKNMLWHNDLLRFGYEKCDGWLYDFKNELKHYVVKQYGRWDEYYAPNKTLLRKNIGGKVDRIIEI